MIYTFFLSVFKFCACLPMFFCASVFSLSLKNPELLNFEVLVNHLPSFTVSFFYLLILFLSIHSSVFVHFVFIVTLSFLLNFTTFLLSICLFLRDLFLLSSAFFCPSTSLHHLYCVFTLFVPLSLSFIEILNQL